MGFQKGHKLAKGRVKGSENTAKKEIKEAFKQLVENNLDNITSWMQRVAEDNPVKALEFMHSFAQFNVPMLSRHQLTDAEDKKLSIEIKHIGVTSRDIIQSNK